MSFTAEEFEGQTVKSLKTLMAKQIGVCRFRQRWLSEDHTELREDAMAFASDVQLVVLDFVRAEDGEVENLLAACRRNLLDEVEMLLRKPLSPDTKKKNGQTALQVAAEAGNLECCALLLEAGANKDAMAFRSRSRALHFAARSGHLDFVRLFLEEGNLNVVDHSGKTALHLAAENGHLEVVKWLLKAGADKDAAVVGFVTALHLAAMQGHLEVVQLLLEVGASNTTHALNVAAMTGHLEVVQLLLGAGADTDEGLHFAATHGQLEVVRLLLEAGADKDATDCHGMRPVDWAAAKKHQKIVQLLEHGS